MIRDEGPRTKDETHVVWHAHSVSREEREPEDVELGWTLAVARIAEDERCRYVDALRPYVERIERELDE